MLAGLYFFGLLGAAIAAVYLWGPRQRLNADIRLVASYQKNPPATAAKSPTAMAK